MQSDQGESNGQLVHGLTADPYTHSRVAGHEDPRTDLFPPPPAPSESTLAALRSARHRPGAAGQRWLDVAVGLIVGIVLGVVFVAALLSIGVTL